MAKSRMDETNIAIIRLLKDGRKSYREIGEELSLTENTVRARVNRMIEEGSISITCLVDPESLRGHKIIFIGVKLKTVDLVRSGKEFLKLKGVISVAVVTGRFDLIVQVLLSEDFDL
ncbi:MAG TPA: AsnC family transcriptional regulator, partial [Spirochaetia bacterium]|nr:AsnC family transcriptional regulator [Spirochaetia bacterium]